MHVMEVSEGVLGSPTADDVKFALHLLGGKMLEVRMNRRNTKSDGAKVSRQKLVEKLAFHQTSSAADGVVGKRNP